MSKRLASLFVCFLLLLPLLFPLTGKAAEEVDPFAGIRYELRTGNATPLVGTTTSLYLRFSTEAIADISSIRYEWYKDGELLPTVKGTRLSIKAAQLSDEGEYTAHVILSDGVNEKEIDCGPLTVRVFKKSDLFGWILVGLLLFAIPTLALSAISLARHLKKKKNNK